MINKSSKLKSPLLREITNYHVSSSCVTIGDIDRYLSLNSDGYSDEEVKKAKSLILPN